MDCDDVARGTSFLVLTLCNLKRCLTPFILPGLVALRHNPTLQVFGARMEANGLAPKAVVGAAMRKLAHLIYGVVKSGKPFDANFAMNGVAIQDGI